MDNKSPDEALLERIKNEALEYRRKHGIFPKCCYVNPSQILELGQGGHQAKIVFADIKVALIVRASPSVSAGLIQFALYQVKRKPPRARRF